MYRWNQKRDIQSAIPSLAFLLAVVFIIYCYWPVLAPLTDGKLQFIYGDFTTKFGEGSVDLREEESFYTFTNGWVKPDTNRFFLLGSLSIFLDYINFSDSQYTSLVILFSILLGSYGLYRLILYFERNIAYVSAVILTIIPFYFLNLWAIERIGHIWIWFSYAIFPIFLSLGITYINNKKNYVLILYSLVWAFFGSLPHSFLYMLLIHFVLTIYSIFIIKNKYEIIKLALLPLIIYILLNMPVFSLTEIINLEYPMEITEGKLDMLSKNGELINALTFSNSWWPQVPTEQIMNNHLFRYSGLLLFVLVFSICIISYEKLNQNEKIFVSLSLLTILGLLFLVQGFNNWILEDIVGRIAELGYIQLLGPFREWARIGILMPVFMSMILIIGISKNENKKKQILLTIFGILLLLNIGSSPGWYYINDAYSAVEIPEEYQTLKKTISDEEKTLWISPENIEYILGTGRYGWDTRKIFGLGSKAGIAPIYRTKFDVISFALEKDAPKVLLDALNVRHVIKEKGGLDEPVFEADYSWLECDEYEHLIICENENQTEPFSTYKGTIFNDGSVEKQYSLSFISQRNFAPSDQYGVHSSFVLAENGTYEEKVLYILEAESDFYKTETISNEKMGVNSSNGGEIFFIRNGIAWDKIKVMDEGWYRLVLFGEGVFDIEMGNKTIDIESISNNRQYSEIFYLEEKDEKLRIKAGKWSLLDVVWIYPIEKNETLEELFESPGEVAEIKEFNRINPTLWKVKINATSPFLLSFAESYHPQWEAKIYENNKKIETIKSICLYGAINGYWINHSGELEVELRYKPQDSFENGLIITIITLIVCIAYILYEIIPNRLR